MKKIFVFIFFVSSLAAFAGSTDILMQGFHWESHLTSPWYNVLKSNAKEIADAKINMIWFPPSGASASDEGYLPNEWYNQNSAYGSVDDLKKTVAAFHFYNVKVIGDIIINHRVGVRDWADFTNPTWGTDAVTSDDEWARGTGAPDTGIGFIAGRDIDHTNPQVRSDIVSWLNWLKKEIGYDGWRYDFSRGYDGKFIEIYNDASVPSFSVGEYWPDYNTNNPDLSRQLISNWLDQTKGKSSAFDYTTKEILREAVASNKYFKLKDPKGKAAGVIGWWPSKAVTFIDNHDTGPSTGGGGGQNLSSFPYDKVTMGYAYILTHPGTPCIYWVHFFDWGSGVKNEIKNLIKLRKDFGIHSESRVDIAVADNSKYAAIIDGKVAVKIGSGDWNPGAGFSEKLRGNNYIIWAK